MMHGARFSDDRCYIIAEAGSNHDGDLDKAHELVEVAAVGGADAVKFQLFRAAELYPSSCGTVSTPIGEVDFFEILQQLELPRPWLVELRDHAVAAGIDFLCTPFDVGAVADLAELGVPALKIASPELTDHALLAAAAATQLPVILSTGMSSLGDIEESLAVLDGAGAASVALLQCVTAYPAPPEDLHLAAIPVLATAFGRRVGLSDHSLHPVVGPSVAVALGATIVEKHITASRSEGRGPDHPFAIEPAELSSLVAAVRQVESVEASERLSDVQHRFGVERVRTVMGSPAKRVVDAERELADCDRRSIHALVPIDEGDKLGVHNIKVLRGERNLRPGLHPRFLDTVLGARATRAIDAGQGVTWDDLLT